MYNVQTPTCMYTGSLRPIIIELILDLLTYMCRRFLWVSGPHYYVNPMAIDSTIVVIWLQIVTGFINNYAHVYIN